MLAEICDTFGDREVIRVGDLVVVEQIEDEAENLFQVS